MKKLFILNFILTLVFFVLLAVYLKEVRRYESSTSELVNRLTGAINIAAITQLSFLTIGLTASWIVYFTEKSILLCVTIFIYALNALLWFWILPKDINIFILIPSMLILLCLIYSSMLIRMNKDNGC